MEADPTGNPLFSGAGAAVSLAGRATVHGLFLERVRERPDAVAIEHGDSRLTYAGLAERARRLAGVIRARGLVPGDRVAILSENRPEYVEAELACAMTGTILACQNWRLSRDELAHCLELVAPALALTSPARAAALADAAPRDLDALEFGPDYERCLAETPPAEPLADLDPEAGLLILYTSGTTGLPKGALISHRAQIARMAAFQLDAGVRPGDGFIAWAPMFHMVSTDHQLATLMSGGTVVVMDGPDAPAIVAALHRHRIGWLVMMPGPAADLIAELERNGPAAPRVACVGAMADLMPRAEVARLTALLKAPYLNTFGSTETGLPPASRALIAPGTTDYSLDKRISSFCELKLVDPDDRPVPDGEPGEMAIRGPTVFSGYWNAEGTNRKDFRGGFFHMGDLFRRNPDGSLSFVDRAKYLIKSGGENIYPAEIERVLLADPRIREAAVIRRPDPKWGEVPVAVIAADQPLTLDEITALCRAKLAGYKRPKALHVIPLEAFPRSTSGKVQRHELERRFGQAAADGDGNGD